MLDFLLELSLGFLLVSLVQQHRLAYQHFLLVVVQIPVAMHPVLLMSFVSIDGGESTVCLIAVHVTRMVYGEIIGVHPCNDTRILASNTLVNDFSSGISI